MNNHGLDRLKIIQSKLPQNTALVVSDPSTIEYLSEFKTLVPNEREAILIITNSKSLLMHAFFSPLPGGIYKVNNLKTTPGCRPQSLTMEAEKLLKEGINTFIIDKDSLFVAEYNAFEKAGKINFLPFDSNLIWENRMVKDDSEIAKIKTATKISMDSFKSIVDQIKPGMSEAEIGLQLDQAMRSQGAELAFPTIVAFGANTALPHHQPSGKCLELNMPVLIDWGAKYQGYCSDMTRSWWHGSNIDPEYKKISSAVYGAYKSVLKGLREALFANKKITASDLDGLARLIIDKAGYGDNFIHTTGHGLGLTIHEPPSLNSQNQTEIVDNMVFTVEPGIYLQDKFGFRYELTVLINGNMIEELAKYEINYVMNFE